jgi:hypothetical protein
MSLNPNPGRFFKPVRFNAVKRGMIAMPSLLQPWNHHLLAEFAKNVGAIKNTRPGSSLSFGDSGVSCIRQFESTYDRTPVSRRRVVTHVGSRDVVATIWEECPCDFTTSG